MVAVADYKKIFLLEFSSKEDVYVKIDFYKKRFGLPVVPFETDIILQLKQELNGYFSRNLSQFNIPIFLQGTMFQNKVWDELLRIPYGSTASYGDIAKAIGKPKAVRAVAFEVYQKIMWVALSIILLLAYTLGNRWELSFF